MRTSNYILALVFLAVALSSLTFLASAQENNRVTIYFFWGEGCTHCANEKIFLEYLTQKYPSLDVKMFEVWYNDENAKIFSDTAEAYGTKAEVVPTTFLADKVWVGFANYIGEQIEDKVEYCIENECKDPVKDSENHSTIDVIYETLFGQVDTSKLSLPVLAIILGGLDGFNPCAFFVLFFLLSMLVYAKSRRRMLLIGGTFIFFSGFIYFLFMAAWLNLFLIMGQVMMITTIAGAVALIIAVVNIKDFFFFEKGVSLAIPDKAKPRLFGRMRNLLKATSIPSILLGTIVLAVAANTFELLCTAGFPMVFTRVLTMNNLSNAEYYIYLILYNIVYILPLLTIVLIFTVTLGARKLTEWQGRILKLISGVMMLCLGAVLLIRPMLLSDILVSIGILAVALMASGLIIVVTKKVK